MGFGDVTKNQRITWLLYPRMFSVRVHRVFSKMDAFWVAGEDGRAWPLEVKGNMPIQWQSLGGLAGSEHDSLACPWRHFEWDGKESA